MAGPSIGTWVKVKNKSGRMTARVIPNKYGGSSYSQGEVITQSEFQKVQKERAKAKKEKGGTTLTDAMVARDAWWAGSKKQIEKKLKSGEYAIEGGRVVDKRKKQVNKPQAQRRIEPVTDADLGAFMDIAVARGKGVMLPNFGRNKPDPKQQRLIDNGYARIVKGRIRLTSMGAKQYQLLKKEGDEWLTQKRQSKQKNGG